MIERVVEPEKRHKHFRDDVIALLRKHAGHLDSSEMLALCAHLTGQIVALQDQRSMSPARAMEIVSKNMELGNREAIDGLMKSVGRS